jgi:single-strand DNA-binding protein
MEGLNQVTLAGNLGADPELRMTSNGQAMLKLRMATSQSYLDKDKKRQERTEWHSVVVWGKRAEGLAKVLGKGSRLIVLGRLQTQSFEDAAGQKRYKTEIVANDVLLQGGGPERRAHGGSTALDGRAGGTGGTYGEGAPGDGTYGAGEVPDDDIPF